MPAVYLNILQSFYNFLWNKDNLTTNQLYNHLLYQLQFFKYFNLFYNHYLLVDQKRFYHQLLHYSLLFVLLEDNNLNVMFYHFQLQKIIQKSLFTPWKLWLTKWFKYWFCAFVFGSDWYLFQLIVLLKPGFNFWSNFALSWVDKVTTRRKCFVSVIANLSAPLESAIAQLDDHVKMRLTSRLINGVSPKIAWIF